MALSQIIYKTIYNSVINYFLRNINYALNTIFKTKIKLPPSGTIKLKTNSGNIKIVTNQTSYITQLIYWNGYKNFEYAKIFESLVKETNSFLDIGANIGFYSLLAAKANSKIKIHAFEPAKGPKYFLKKNIAINNFESKITAVDLALSNKKGIIDFYEVDNLKYKYLEHNLAGEGNTGTKKTSRNFVINTVNTNTLDNFIELNKLKSVDLIKLDTEGTEFNILKSGIESIKKHQPIIICETLFNTTETNLNNFFSDLGYTFYNHTKKGLLQVGSIERVQDNGIRNCFFVPASKLDLVQKFVI
ncbi:FkbM family methyltransferase [Lacinutrix sp. MedPE-SW]|uniref:FkbM family methyltransferase n=1 Tax=Lacinutrix sp. MedPE-SW TaxID=1860087 RepID=UPI0009197DDA|nr:FkbM family methyltransferase [Lacinutrix sp. MedPE-SW]OIQ21929.1 MAG: hypothetical protein BM549_08315 [Lacinutrix sp. MedPE-SW]